MTNNKNKRYIFLDFEFNSVKKIQEIVSVGVVVCDSNFKITDTYYSLVSLSMSKKMDKYASSINKITDDMLITAPNFKQVFHELNTRLNLNQEDKIFTWGYDDKRTFHDGLKHHNLEDDLNLMLNSFTDIQKEISLKIKFNDKLISNRMALKSVKKIYNIQGNVTHNALDDAIDLMNIYKEFINNNINYSIVEKIYLEKIEKSKKKNELRNNVNRFSSDYPNGVSTNILDSKIYRLVKTLINSKHVIYSNCSILKLDNNMFTLNSETNKKIDVIKDTTYDKLIFNFTIDKDVFVISFISDSYTYKFHITLKKNFDIIYAIVNRLV